MDMYHIGYTTTYHVEEGRVSEEGGGLEVYVVEHIDVGEMQMFRGGKSLKARTGPFYTSRPDAGLRIFVKFETHEVHSSRYTVCYVGPHSGWIG